MKPYVLLFEKRFNNVLPHVVLPGEKEIKKAPCESFSMKLTCLYPKATRQKDTFYVSVKKHLLSSALVFLFVKLVS